MASGELVRSKSNRMIAGVCGGIAQWMGWDPTVVRFVFVILTIFSAAFPGVIIYLVLALLMPLEK